MAQYVDGFVIVIKKKNVAKYKKMATLGRNVWMEYGALDYCETVANDVKQPWGGIPFDKLCKLKPDETVIFAYIRYKSKTHRDKVNAKVHKDPRMSSEKNSQYMEIMDMKKFTMGGFEVLVRSRG